MGHDGLRYSDQRVDLLENKPVTFYKSIAITKVSQGIGQYYLRVSGKPGTRYEIYAIP